MTEKPIKLTENQFEVLDDLSGHDASAWLRPLDIGGHDGSHHSGSLGACERKGLVESRQRASWTGRRGSKEYRLTPKGVEIIEHERLERSPGA